MQYPEVGLHPNHDGTWTANISDYDRLAETFTGSREDCLKWLKDTEQDTIAQYPGYEAERPSRGSKVGSGRVDPISTVFTRICPRSPDDGAYHDDTEMY